jgi:uncharacterized Zn finger protein (UPF0148 family)
MTQQTHCHRCGLKLQVTNWGRLFCTNCSQIVEELKESEEKKEELKYVG